MKKPLLIALSASLLLPTLSGCVAESASSNSEVLFVGMMGAPKVLDPAGTRSLEDLALLQQLYPSVMNADAATGNIVPELASSASYTGEFEYTVELKPDLTFANGNELTASDVVHSIDRIKTINDPAGPAVLLQSLASVAVVGDTTVVFTPTRAFDQALPGLLAGLPGLVVDEEVFPADALLANSQIVGSGAFAGPYTLTGYNEGSALRLDPNPAYAGIWGVPKNKGLEIRYYNNAEQLMFDSGEMVIDLAIVHRQSLSESTGAATEAFAIDYLGGPAVETGMLLVNASSGVFAAASYENPRSAKDLARVFLGLVDRDRLIKDVFGGLYDQATSLIPADLGGKGDSQDDLISDRNAKKVLADAGVEAPLQVEVTYPETAYGVSVVALMTQLKTMVDESGVIEVVLKPLSDAGFAEARAGKRYEVLFDLHYPAYNDGEAFVYPMVNTLAANGADARLIDLVATELARPDTESLRDHEASLRTVDANLLNSNLVKPLYWAGRHALVRDGVLGAETMLSPDGKLVLAALYRNVVGTN